MSIENIINNSHRSIHIVCLSTFRIIHINFHNPIKLKKKIYSFDSLSFQIIVFTIYNLIYIYQIFDRWTAEIFKIIARF